MSSSHYVLPNIDPIAISLGPLDIRWYGLMYLVGFAYAFWMANRVCDNSKGVWTREQASDLLFAGFMGVILGGRIGYVFFYQFPTFLDNPLYLFRIWEGGMSFHGGVIGVVTAIIIYAKRQQRSILSVGDFIVPLLPVGLGAGRIGNFINSELWGRVTDSPFGIIFHNAGPLPRHPSQLYEFALEGVLLLIILLLFIRKPKPAGSVAGLFLLGYGTFRFIIEFAREPDAHLGLLTLGLSMGQILSLPMIIIGSALMVYAYKVNPIQAEKNQSKKNKGNNQ
ncbi:MULTISPECIES: prolipoprotein diacylglyceryl transferase [Psychromonas]|uniref:prolipoprotein diacylglyceryl transferase n=1 Tax=Psychromonas TaxID=67572 RepID=UPI00041ADC8D|nr:MULTISPECIES: prolipoprotein diacylglyceryl transferase [Psychromonas]MBB1273845.1 prolipoprotein diacylglyceryl transferase [Psychromonas sp. SR45-3]